MGSRWDRDPQDDEWDDWERDDDGGNGWGTSSRAAQGRRGNRPVRPQRSYPSSAQQRQYPANPPQMRYQSASWQAASPRVAAGRQPPGGKKGGSQRVIGALIILVALVGGIGGYVERSHIKALFNRPAATTTAAPSLVLPAFADWRVAYLGQDGQLHAVSLDGQTDSAGISLPAQAAAGTPIATSSSADISGHAYASPDGHYVVYNGAGGVEVLHLTAQQGAADAARSAQSAPSVLLWSADSTHLAGLAADGSVHLIDMTLADTKVPSTAGTGIQEILGWIDAGHLAVRVDKTGATSEVAASLDITSGAQRTIVSLYKPGYGTLRYSLSPDGAHLFVWNTAISGQSFTAILRNYDTKTGTIHKLPKSATAISTGITAAVWQPGTQKVAISSGSVASHSGKLWLVDAANDAATAIGTNVYPLGWLPDGTQLIAGSALTPSAGGGPYTLSTFIFSSSGSPKTVTLTTKAMTFPWLGLVKTA